MALSVKLQVFEGPLDLLLHLIEKNKIDIYTAKNFYKKQTLPPEIEQYRPPVDYEELLGDINLRKLQEIFESVMKRQEDKIDPIRAGFGKIEKEEVDMEQKTRYIEGYIGSHSKMSFRDLLQKQHSKAEVIVTFLVILEMMKTGKIDIYQAHTFDDIEITRKGTGNNGGTE